MRKGSRIKVWILKSIKVSTPMRHASRFIFTYTREGAIGIRVQKGWQKFGPIEMCLPTTSAQIPRERYLSVFNAVSSISFVHVWSLINGV